MLIEVTGKGPVAIAGSLTRDEKQRAVKEASKGQNRKDARLATKALSKTLVLIPGVNTIPDEMWENLKKNENIEQMLSDERLKVVPSEQDAEEIKNVKEGEAQAKDLSGIKGKDAVAIVEKCLNKELLEDWANNESRVHVKRAIEIQLQKLVVEPKKKEASG